MYSINNLYLKETNTGYLYIHECPCAWPRHNNIRKKIRNMFMFMSDTNDVQWNGVGQQHNYYNNWTMLHKICYVHKRTGKHTYNNLLAELLLFFWSGYMGNAHCLPALNYWLTCTCSIEQRGDIIICLILFQKVTWPWTMAYFLNWCKNKGW